jgi:hypothetical protein
LTDPLHKTRVVIEAVPTFSSFRFPELSQPIWSYLLLAISNLLEVDMFARSVSIHLRSNMLSDYNRTFDKDILPILRRQEGFTDEITLSNPGNLDVVAISLWESKASAEAYNTKAYPEVLKAFATMIDGTPRVQTFEFVTSTFHKVAVAA